MGYSRGSLALLVLIVLVTAGCTTSSSQPISTPVSSPVLTTITTIPTASNPVPIAEATHAAAQDQPRTTIIPAGFPVQYDGIRFEGDVDINCSLQTVHALDLLDTKSHDDFLTITKYIGVIECRDDWSGMYGWENPPRFRVGKATRDSGVIWYAGAIAHDSCHSRQYNDYAKVHFGETVPLVLFSGEAAEIECINYQYGVLEKIGAPKKMLDYVSNSSSTRYWETKDVWW